MKIVYNAYAILNIIKNSGKCLWTFGCHGILLDAEFYAKSESEVKIYILPTQIAWATT